MRYRWPKSTVFRRVPLEPEDRDCPFCQRFMHLCDHRHHKIFTLTRPMHIVSKLAHCPDLGCPGHHKTFSSDAEMHLTMPWWLVGWDVFAWIGHRRFARHWSVPRMPYVDRNILRLAVFEILDHKEQVPPKVAIDEAVELGKRYGAKKSGGFINGVLDRIWQESES